MIYIYGMSFKEKIDERGLKILWVAKQIDENYNSLRVYLSDENKMPIHIQDKLKSLLN